MPRKPIGDQALTDAERQRKRRERLRKEDPVQTARQTLNQALAEIERLKAELAAARAGKAEAAQPRAPLSEPEKKQQAHGARPSPPGQWSAAWAYSRWRRKAER